MTAVARIIDPANKVLPFGTSSNTRKPSPVPRSGVRQLKILTVLTVKNLKLFTKSVCPTALVKTPRISKASQVSTVSLVFHSKSKKKTIGKSNKTMMAI